MPIVLVLLLFSYQASANWFPVGKDGANTNYWEKGLCESQEGQACYEVKSCPLDECDLGQVDDLSRPKYLKKSVVECSGQQDCQAKLEVQDCSSHAQGTGALINADYSEVYCAEPNGYEKKPGMVVNPDKVEAKQAAKAAEDARRALITNGLKRQEIGKRIIALIVANNDAKNLTVEQSLQLAQSFQPIIGLLQVGAIESAKAQVQALTPDGTLMTEADKTLALSQFQSEGY